jgi:glucose-6-phosphate isomerase
MQKIKLDFNNALSINVRSGIKTDDINNLMNANPGVYTCINADGFFKTGWYGEPSDGEIESIGEYAEFIRLNYENLVVFGIGGSALGARAVHYALNHAFFNDLPPEIRKAPRLFIEDTVDPHRLSRLFEIVDPKKTMFNVISKSGKTAETLSQLMLTFDLLRARGLKPADHIVLTIGARECDLYGLAKAHRLRIFWLDEDIGGRFSVLTAVGLLPLAAVGIDIKKILKGAGELRELSKNKNIFKNPPLMLAAINYLLLKKGRSNIVFMPYSDSLSFFADWFCQLWAESLGKKFDLRGRPVNVGQTPIKAVGTLDQHSQLQLYMEGPDDKVILLAELKKSKADIKIPGIRGGGRGGAGGEGAGGEGEGGTDGGAGVGRAVKCADGRAGGGATGAGATGAGADFDPYKDKTLLQIINAQKTGCEFSLLSEGRPNMTLLIDEIDERAIGQLLMFFMTATAFSGYLLNVNPYNQDGVEAGKLIAKEILTGGAAVKKYAKDGKYII